MLYACMWQVSLGLKEDEEGSQAPSGSWVIFSCTENVVFVASRSTALKLASCQEATSTVINVYDI